MAERGTQSSEFVTLMYVPGPAGNIRRFNLRRSAITTTLMAAVIGVLATGLLSAHYVTLLGRVAELERLRVETREQRTQISEYAQRMEGISTKLQNVSQLDRKLRVITNLDPADELPLPGIGGLEGERFEVTELALRSGRRHQKMIEGLATLRDATDAQGDSLAALIAHLEDQTARLGATPSISPTKGWATSGFDYRSSPFTGKREFHRGLDIAGRIGTPIVAPADGEVRFAGKQRALGYTVILRHGYGIETSYGHLSEIRVKRGQKVMRGERLALMGNTGRSTGPHLHYQVELNGKPVNPRNYILD